jgi:flagellar motor protein MotB
MSRGLATLSINLEARLAELQAGFDKAARLAEKNAADVEARYNRLASAAASVGTALAGAFSGAVLVQFFRTTVNGLDALNDLADATGASIENLSALEDIAARTGTAFETVGSALVRFNAELATAKEGSQTAEILRRIGLSAQELRQQDPAEALRRTAVALAQFADDGDKARAVQALFGKSVGEVAPLLKDLAEAGQLNATVTAEQAQEAERFNRQLAEFTKNLSDAGRAITGEVLGPLNRLLEGFAALNRLQLLNFGSVVEVLKGNTFADPAEGAAFYSEQLERLQRQYEIIATTTSGVSRRGSLIDLSKDIEQITRLRDFYRLFAQRELPQASYSNEGRNAPRLFGDLPEPTRPARAAQARPTDTAGTVLDPLRKAAQDLVDATDLQRLGQLQLQLQGLFELGGDKPSPAVVEAIQKVGLAINELTPGQRELRASQSRLAELLANTPTGRLTSVLADIKLLNAELGESPETLQQWAEAVRAVTARLPRDTEQALEELSEITQQFQRNVQDVLGDNIASALRGDFDSIEDAWKTMLLNMAAQAAAAELTKGLFGADGRGGWLASLAGFFGFAKGGVFSQGQQITAFADGGVLTRPTFFGMGGGRMGVAGEAGAEGILPLRRGPGGRLGVEAYGGGGTTNIYNVAAGVTRSELVSALQLMSQQTEARVMSNLRTSRVI